MPYISTYAYQFWIKGTSAKTISFSCGNVFKKFDVTKDWQYFSIIFEVEEINNIHLEFPKGQYWIYNMKLEIGQYLTDWSPHPEDGISAYEEKFDNIEKLLVQHASSIQNTISMVDKTNQEILNSVSKTTFESEIIGMQKSISDRFTDVEDGYGKWYVSVFDKSQFKNVYYDKEEPVEESDIPVTPVPTPTDTPTEDTGGEGSSGDSESTGADTTEDGETTTPTDTATNTSTKTVTTALVDRECNDMSIFGLENANVVPIDEMLVDDDPIAMRINGKDKILYYLAFAKFNQNTRVDINCSHNRGTVYLNGIPKGSFDSIGTTPLIFDFSEGWNIIEMVANEGNMSFNTKISEHPNCVLFNCLMGVPTSRTTKIREQGTSLNIYLDKIVSEVFDTTQETKDGVTTRKVERSKIEQNKEKIDFVVERRSDADSQDSSSSQFTITANAVSAITPQMVIEGPIGTGTTVISGGHVQANSITAKMLSTNAIMSQNFIAHNATDVIPEEDPTDEEGSSGSDDETGSDEQEDPYANVQWSQDGSFLDLANGNFYTPSLYLKNLVRDNDGNIIENAEAWFRGTIIADNGKFNGIITSTGGEIGGWNINEQGIWRGAETFAAATSRGMYLGDGGINFGSKLIYHVDEHSEALRLNIDALSIVGKPTNEKILKNGARLYSNAGEPPTTANKDQFPYTAWEDINSFADHVNDIYLDNITGKTYVFKRSQQARYKIKFNTSSALRPARDYIQIFYIYEKSMHKVTPILTAEFGQDEITIPTENFYIYFHVGDPTSGLDERYKYGFEIDSVTPLDNLEAELSRNIALQNLPPYPIDASLQPGAFPKTSHPYTQANYNKIWYCQALTDDAQFYEWEEIEDVDLSPSTQDLAEALSYLHYDIQNGVILYNNTTLNDNYEYVRAALPDKVLSNEELNSIIGGNIRLNSNGLGIYNDNELLASYGSTFDIYNKGSVVASYGDSTTFYTVKSMQDPLDDEQLLKVSLPSVNINAEDGLTIYKITSTTDPITDAIVPISVPVTTVDVNGLNIYNNDGDLLANYGDTVKFYRYYEDQTSTSNERIPEVAAELGKSGLDIKRGQITLGLDLQNRPVFQVTSDGALTARNANIGGVTVGSDAIYSPGHTTYDSSTAGFYLGSNGNFGVGDSDQYLQFYKDENDNNKWKIRLSVTSLSIGGKDVKTDYSGEIEGATSAGGKTATNYLYYDIDNGLVIHREDESFTSGSISKLGTPNIRLTSNGMDIYNGNTLLASYGANSYFYRLAYNYSTQTQYNDPVAKFGADGFEVLKGKVGNIYIESDKLYSGSNNLYHSTYDSSNSGFYLGSDGKFGVGNGSSYIRYDGSKISIAVSELTIGTTSLDQYIKNQIPSDSGSGSGSSTSTDSAYFSFETASKTQNGNSFPAGLYIHAYTPYESNRHVLVSGASVQIRNGGTVMAEFGDEIKLYTNNNSNYSYPPIKIWAGNHTNSSDPGSHLTLRDGASSTIQYPDFTFNANYSTFSLTSLGNTVFEYSSTNGIGLLSGTTVMGDLSCSTYTMSCGKLSASKDVEVTDNLFLKTVGGTKSVSTNSIASGRIYSKTPAGYQKNGAQWTCLMTLNSENNLHIGAINVDETINGNYAKSIYLDADNLYNAHGGNYASISDYKFKYDIKNINKSKDFIMKLLPKIFKYKDGTSNRYHTGFIAQDVEKAMNNTIGDFGVFCKVDLYETHKEEDLVCMLRYEEIIAPHVAVTQEHEYRIQKQEEEITNLKSEVADLKEQIKLLLEKLGDK